MTAITDEVTMAGRRSGRQLLALPWQGAAGKLLPIFNSGVVRPPPHDLVEWG